MYICWPTKWIAFRLIVLMIHSKLANTIRITHNTYRELFHRISSNLSSNAFDLLNRKECEWSKKLQLVLRNCLNSGIILNDVDLFSISYLWLFSHCLLICIYFMRYKTPFAYLNVSMIESVTNFFRITKTQFFFSMKPPRICYEYLFLDTKKRNKLNKFSKFH